MIYQFLILCLSIIFVIIFIYFFANLINENGMKSYDVLLPIKGDGENMNYCLNGCTRGSCVKNNSPNSCKYDFQCNYCQDKKTNMFYVDFNNNIEKEIIPIYEEENLNLTQKDMLNESIENNNEYIKELNDRIKNLNQLS
jgi:hypothetical protein